MTFKNKPASARRILSSISENCIPIEIRRGTRGASMNVSEIVAVSEYSENEITLLTHRGRIRICGSGLILNTFESRTVEVIGCIEEIRFLYGRN